MKYRRVTLEQNDPGELLENASTIESISPQEGLVRYMGSMPLPTIF